MSTTVQDRPLLVIRTRVVRVPVEDLLAALLAPYTGDEQPDAARDERTAPERVLEERPATSEEHAAALAAEMAETHPEVGDRQRIKIVRSEDR